MLWPTLAWSTGLAGGIGSAFAVNSLPWRYAPPMGVWLGGLWLNTISSGLLKRAGEGAIWGGAGSFVGLAGYDLWKQYQEWFGKEIAPQPEAAPPQTPPSETTQQKTPKSAPPATPETDIPSTRAAAPFRAPGIRPTMGSIFFTPPRVSQGHYPSRSSWWGNP